MKITNPEHRKQIRTEFAKLLAENGFSLRSFCVLNDLDAKMYRKIYENLNRYASTDLLFLQEIISKIDPKKKVFLQNGKFVISKPY